MDGEHYFSAEPRSEARPRRIRVVLDGAELELETAGGTFSPDRLDAGTAVLLDHVPDPDPFGPLLDVGCGWGPIAITMARRSPDAEVWAVDVNERALALAAANARIADVHVKTASPEDIPADLAFTTIWSNPPIRVGKDELHGILATWLPRLRPGGEAWLVVSKQLGGDTLQRWIAAEFGFLDVRRAATAKGYRVIRAVRDQTATTPE